MRKICPTCGKEFVMPAKKYICCSRKCSAIYRTVDQLTRFWNKVEKTKTCWNWIGAKSKKGYGVFNRIPHTQQAHRFSYELHNNVTLPTETYVCHKCDNTSCVRPSHLFIGSQKDNLQDAAKKGRMPSGENHYRKRHPENVPRGVQCTHKINEDQVRQIRNLAGTDTKQNIANTFGVSSSLVRYIINRKRWGHVI